MFTAHIKKILFVFAFFAFLTMRLTTPTFAQSMNFNTDQNVQSNSHNIAQVLLIEVTSAVLCQLTGIDYVNPHQGCLGVNLKTNKIGFASDQTSSQQVHLGGAIGMMSGLITKTYDVPIHTSDYTNDLASNFGFIKPALAQTNVSGGFTSLSGVEKLWVKIRDLTYLAFVFMFVIIGFAIMLRLKIDPRTTMSIQNQIPKIVISILLITLSYAIAGLLIDMMWVTTYTGINILAANAPGNCPHTDYGNNLNEIATNTLLDTPIQYVSRILNCPFPGFGGEALTIERLAGSVGQTLGDIIQRVLLGALYGDVNVDSGYCTKPPFLGFDLVKCAQFEVYDIGSWILGALATLIISIGILVQLVRLWFSLLKSYIYLIIYTIAAPIWIFLGLVPGTTNYGFGSWVRHMLSSLAVYPVTVFFFLIAIILASDSTINTSNPALTTGQAFVPPLIANPSISSNMGWILALASILVVPEVVGMMRTLFKAPPSNYTKTIIGGVTAGAAGAAMVAQPVFGKDKQGRVGPGTFYARRAVNNIGSNIAKKAMKIPAIEDLATRIKNSSYADYRKQEPVQIWTDQNGNKRVVGGPTRNTGNNTDNDQTNPTGNTTTPPTGGGSGSGSGAGIPNQQNMSMPGESSQETPHTNPEGSDSSSGHLENIERSVGRTAEILEEDRAKKMAGEGKQNDEEPKNNS